MKRFGIAVLVTAIAVSTAMAQGVWRTDKAHSNVTFAISHLIVSEVVGTVNEWDITVTSKKDDWSDATVEAALKTSSIDTENERRDNHLKQDDFFNAEKFPEMKFISTGFEKVGEKRYQINGNLTIRDITKPVTFNAELVGTVTDPQMGTRVGWQAVAEINRFDFGLKWSRTTEAGGLIAGETVKITINLELVKQAS